MGDFEFAALILQTRLDNLPNPNTPLAQKLRCAIHALKFLDSKEKNTPR